MSRKGYEILVKFDVGSLVKFEGERYYVSEINVKIRKFLNIYVEYSLVDERQQIIKTSLESKMTSL